MPNMPLASSCIKPLSWRRLQNQVQAKLNSAICADSCENVSILDPRNFQNYRCFTSSGPYIRLASSLARQIAATTDWKETTRGTSSSRIAGAVGKRSVASSHTTICVFYQNQYRVRCSLLLSCASFFVIWFEAMDHFFCCPIRLCTIFAKGFSILPDSSTRR